MSARRPFLLGAVRGAARGAIAVASCSPQARPSARPVARKEALAIHDAGGPFGGARVRISPKTVLVVQGVSHAYDLLKRALRLDGYRVTRSKDVSEAITLAERMAPTAILIDLELPGLDGMAALRVLRQRGHRGALVVLDGKGTTRAAREAMLSGADDYIAGPLTSDVVRLALRDASAERQELRRGDRCER